VESPERLKPALRFTPTHEQVRIAPRSEAMSGGHGDLLISPIKGEGARQLSTTLSSRRSIGASTGPSSCPRLSTCPASPISAHMPGRPCSSDLFSILRTGRATGKKLDEFYSRRRIAWRGPVETAQVVAELVLNGVLHRYRPAAARRSDGFQFSAPATLMTFSKVTLRSPRSILPIWERSISAASANAS